jgi:CheY-like chemotaxis protein
MSRKILVADESDAIRSAAVNVFRQKGHEVLTASGGEEAWEILKSGKIDLAILNSTLSGMDGYTISKLIREDPSVTNTKSILLLSASEVVNQHQLITAQPDGTLNKPFAPPDLLSRAGDVLGEDFGMKDKGKNKEPHTTVSEMNLEETENSGEIDFEAIFAEQEKNAGDDDIHFTEIVPQTKNSSGESGKAKIVDALVNKEDDKKSEEGPTESKSDQDEGIRLADDQYGLEEPFEPPEVEKPHDYNWFIREMKNEIEDKPKSNKPKPEPVKSEKKKEEKSSEDATGMFTVEEIGISKGDPKGDQTAKGSKEDSESLLSNLTDPMDPDYFDNIQDESSKLSLAEKLLVKELARKMAEKIIGKIPRDQLRQLLDDMFSEIKKY